MLIIDVTGWLAGDFVAASLCVINAFHAAGRVQMIQNVSKKFSKIPKFWNFIMIFEISVRNAFK